MKYEYEVQEYDSTATLAMRGYLNKLGEKGWKVVGIAMQPGSLIVTVVLMREVEGSHVR